MSVKHIAAAAIAIAVLGVVGIVGASYWRMSNQIEAVIGVGQSIAEGGVEGVTDQIDATGEGAVVVREHVTTAVEVATEGVDLQAVDQNIDGATNWLGNKVGNLRDALSGDEPVAAPTE